MTVVSYIWDSNFPKALHDESCLYYDSETLDYCIPYYGVHVTDGADDNTAGVITVCNDLKVLNAYPHSLIKARGDINRDGNVTISDAILLARICAEDDTVENCTPQDMNGDGTITVSDVIVILRMLAGVTQSEQ